MSAELTEAAGDLFRELVASTREEDVLAGIEMAGTLPVAGRPRAVAGDGKSSQAPEAHGPRRW